MPRTDSGDKNFIHKHVAGKQIYLALWVFTNKCVMSIGMCLAWLPVFVFMDTVNNTLTTRKVERKGGDKPNIFSKVTFSMKAWQFSRLVQGCFHTNLNCSSRIHRISERLFLLISNEAAGLQQDLMTKFPQKKRLKHLQWLILTIKTVGRHASI